MNLHRLFLSSAYRRKSQSAMVSIAESPLLLAAWISERDRLGPVLGHMYPADVEPSGELKAVAKQVLTTAELGLARNPEADQDAAGHAELEVRREPIEKSFNQVDPNSKDDDTAQSDLESIRRSQELNLLLGGLQLHRHLARDLRVSGDSRYIKTTLRPLGRETTAQLLWHGYYQTMMNAAVLLDGCPMMKPFPPQLADFENLAAGRIRGTRYQPMAPG